MKQFRLFRTSDIIEEDYLKYIENFLEKNPGCKVAVGTDSKCRTSKRRIVYATCIAIFYPGVDGYDKGAHVIYSKEKLVGKMPLFERLWEEVDRSRIIASEIEDELQVPVEIHVDINPDKDFKSNVAYQPAIGMLQGMGYTVLAKPEAPAASCAADVLVNR